MKDLNKSSFSFLKFLLGFFLLSSFAFGESIIVRSSSNTVVDEGDTASINFYISPYYRNTYYRVTYRTYDGSASSNDDYISSNGWKTVYINGNSYYTAPFDGTIQVNTLTDSLTESDENFTIRMRLYRWNGYEWRYVTSKNTQITIVDTTSGIDNNVTFGTRDFKIRNPESTRNINGNIRFIGNTVLCVRNRYGNCYDYSGSKTNADLSLSFINTDNYNGTYRNSSRALLDIPEEATIVWAAFYTQGYLYKTRSQMESTLSNNPTMLSIPNMAEIPTYPHEANINNSGLTGFAYGTYTPINELIGKTGLEVNGWVSAKGVKSQEGKTRDDNDGLGNYGAWTLVVIYRDDDESLKNISVFDGYKVVSSSNGGINITVDGFLTPSGGDVNSTLSIFAAEGDKNIQGDKLSLDGVWIENNDGNTNNAFNSYVKGVTANPSFTNNQGIDIQNHDVSDIIKNSQTSATVALTSNQDTYFPSVVIFSTELYSPKVCYEEHIYYNGKEVPFEITPITGSTLDTNITVRNEGHEEASKIRFFTSFDQNFSYVDDSLLVGNTNSSTGEAEPEVANSPLATIVKPNENNDSNISIYLGRNATSTQGGTFEAMKSATAQNYEGDSATLSYQMTFYDPNFQEQKYYIEYKNNITNTFYKTRIYECEDTNRSFTGGVLGNFNAVSKKASGYMENDAQDSKNSLYTQIARKAFDVWIVSLKDSGSKKALNSFTGQVKVDIINSIDYTSCKKTNGSYNQSCVDILCNKQAANSPITLNFNKEEQKQASFNIENAAQTLMFRMKYKNSSNENKCATSLDNFAVRPATYSVKLINKITNTKDTSPYIGGKDYNLSVVAITDDKNISNYNGSQVAAELNSNFVAGCGVTPTTDDAMLAFNGGKVIEPAELKTSNIGEYTLSITDSTWTDTDQSIKSSGSADCILDSSENTKNSEGKVGCSVGYEEDFVFIPKEFRSKMFLQNANIASDFTYISSDNGMMATLRPNFEAVLDDVTPADIWDNPIATAYDKNCYANNINYDINLTNANPTDWGRATTAKADIHYDENTDPDTTITTAKNANPITARTVKNAFTDGVANPIIQFNFTRNAAIGSEDEPFTLIRGDFNISRVIDETNNKVGTDSVHVPQIDPTIPAANEDIEFYFGRVWSPDVVGTSPITSSLRYEVYCSTCAVANYPLAGGGVNPVSNEWRLNTFHTAADGSVNGLTSLHPQGPGKGSTIARNGPANNIVGGYENNVVFTAQANPTYTDTIRIDLVPAVPAHWLRTTDPSVTYTGNGNWSGEGQLGNVLNDTDAPVRSNGRINW